MNRNYDIVVLSPKQSERWKYWKNQPVYREYGYWWTDDNIPNQNKFRFRHNALEKTKKNAWPYFKVL